MTKKLSLKTGCPFKCLKGKNAYNEAKMNEFSDLICPSGTSKSNRSNTFGMSTSLHSSVRRVCFTLGCWCFKLFKSTLQTQL